jgi:hypothetical protein
MFDLPQWRSDVCRSDELGVSFFFVFTEKSARNEPLSGYITFAKVSAIEYLILICALTGEVLRILRWESLGMWSAAVSCFARK